MGRAAGSSSNSSTAGGAATFGEPRATCIPASSVTASTSRTTSSCSQIRETSSRGTAEMRGAGEAPPETEAPPEKEAPPETAAPDDFPAAAPEAAPAAETPGDKTREEVIPRACRASHTSAAGLCAAVDNPYTSGSVDTCARSTSHHRLTVTPPAYVTPSTPAGTTPPTL